jgi:hypothetical protein
MKQNNWCLNNFVILTIIFIVLLFFKKFFIQFEATNRTFYLRLTDLMGKEEVRRNHNFKNKTKNKTDIWSLPGCNILRSLYFSLRYVTNETLKRPLGFLIGLFTVIVVVFVIRFTFLKFKLSKFLTKRLDKSSNYFFQNDGRHHWRCRHYFNTFKNKHFSKSFFEPNLCE